MKITPMMCGSAFKNKGVQAMLDAVIQYLPVRTEIENVKGVNPNTDQEEERKADPKDKFAALAFKIMTDPFVGRLAFFHCIPVAWMQVRMCSTHVPAKNERISRIIRMHANKQNRSTSSKPVISVLPLVSRKSRPVTRCAMSATPIILESMSFQTPVIGLAIEPKPDRR